MWTKIWTMQSQPLLGVLMRYLWCSVITERPFPLGQVSEPVLSSTLDKHEKPLSTLECSCTVEPALPPPTPPHPLEGRVRSKKGDGILGQEMRSLGVSSDRRWGTLQGWGWLGLSTGADRGLPQRTEVGIANGSAWVNYPATI